MFDELVVRGEHVLQIVSARDARLLRIGARVSAQVERERAAAGRRDLPRARELLLLAAAPAVHAQHARYRRRRRDERAGDVSAVDVDLYLAVMRRHTARPSCTS